MLRSFLYKDNFFVGHPQMIMIFLIEACYAYIPKIKSAVMVIVLTTPRFHHSANPERSIQWFSLI